MANPSQASGVKRADGGIARRLGAARETHGEASWPSVCEGARPCGYP